MGVLLVVKVRYDQAWGVDVELVVRHFLWAAVSKTSNSENNISYSLSRATKSAVLRGCFVQPASLDCSEVILPICCTRVNPNKN